jgi:chromosomal replication initiator protein
MHDSLWQAVLGEIELSVSRASYITWFKNTKVIRHDDSNNTLVIGVPNVFIKQQLEKRYDDLIKQTLQKNGIQPEQVEYKIHSGIGQNKRSVDEPLERQATNQKAPTTNALPVTPHKPKPKQSASVLHKYRQGLNERYTFDNFIVGSGNELAHAACQAVAQSVGRKYNPLFIYGGVGIGKTHLIQAVGNAIASQDPDAHIVYVSTEQFVQEFIDAVRFKKNTDFAGYYRNADVLIIDDMQFIAGKDKTQEEFFHTFNALYQANKQIIISSDKPPKDIPTLEERLRSRFEWGMSIDMQNPDFETRCAIIQTKADTHNIELSQDIIDFLAELVQTNIRELEGALNQLLAFCEMRELTPDLAIAQTLLGNSRGRPKHISVKHVIEKTAKFFQKSPEELVGPKRDKDIVLPRQVAMYLLRSELHLSFPKIASELGRKDHTTAMHSIEKIEKSNAYDPDVKDAITQIKERLYA